MNNDVNGIKIFSAQVLVLRSGNLYAANGAGVVLAEKGLYDVSKDIFTQVRKDNSFPSIRHDLAHKVLLLLSIQSYFFYNLQVQEAASGNIFVQMPDVWINLANVYFSQGQFTLAVKMVPPFSLLPNIYCYFEHDHLLFTVECRSLYYLDDSCMHKTFPKYE